MKDIKLAGMVTLYNPTKEDINNINSYINDIDKLYIYDNTEGNSNKDKIPKNKKIEYIFNNNNAGVAKALNDTAKLAIKDGYKYLLTMDQDSKFKDGVVKGLKEDILNHDMKDIAIVTPWHETKLMDKKPDVRFDNPHDVMTSGNILNLDIWKKLGGFKEWLFIDGIDIEYSINLHKKGYKILRDNNLVLEHNLGDIFYKKLPGRLYLCTNHPAIRRYYIMRNYHYIFDMYKDDKEELPYLYSLISQRHNMIGVIFFEKKDKLKKIKYYIRGYKDYKKGIKGKYPYKN